MKTTSDALDVLFKFINDSTIKPTISGGIYKLKRPTSSTLEDVVINSVALGDSNYQEGVLNVNAYVPNITVNNSSLPNTARIKAIENACKVLQEVYGEGYSFWVSSTSIYEETDIKSHYINNRIEFRFIG